MKAQRHQPRLESGPVCSAPRLAALLLRYDDLDPLARAGLERHVAICPECGPRWQLFHRVDQWLETAGGERPAACPESEELYDYGRGPGHRPLSGERRAELETHLVHCEPCRGFATTLETPVSIPIPIRKSRAVEVAAEVPARVSASVAAKVTSNITSNITSKVAPKLEVTPEVVREQPAPRPDPQTEQQPERRDFFDELRPWLHLLKPFERVPAWVPVAVAAGLLLTIQFAIGGWDKNSDLAGEVLAGTEEGIGSLPRSYLPDLPVLRGEKGGLLIFPRGKLLAGGEGLTPQTGLTFELLAAPDAESYRVSLFRHAGGAFDAGEFVTELKSPTPQFDAGAWTLDAGHYTWEAWATVRGLERPLGERDFEVALDPELFTRWIELKSLDEPERGQRRVALLHERGFFGEARALARGLPQTEKRDAYLEAWPGR